LNYQLLENFIKNRIRKGDVYVPAMIVMLLKNDGQATKEEVARLIYILEFKHSLQEYETIVENFSFVLLSDYNLVRQEGSSYKLTQWPLNREEIDKLITLCYHQSDGFFKNLGVDSQAA
jgi:hypothetical protein